MDEVQRRSVPGRLSCKERILAFLMAAILILGLMQPPPARAIGPVTMTVAGIALVYMACVGINYTVISSDKVRLTDALAKELSKFATAAGITLDVLFDIISGGTKLKNGALVLSAAAVLKLKEFTTWLTTASGDIVLGDASYIRKEGNLLYVGSVPFDLSNHFLAHVEMYLPDYLDNAKVIPFAQFPDVFLQRLSRDCYGFASWGVGDGLSKYLYPSSTVIDSRIAFEFEVFTHIETTIRLRIGYGYHGGFTWWNPSNQETVPILLYLTSIYNQLLNAGMVLHGSATDIPGTDVMTDKELVITGVGTPTTTVDGFVDTAIDNVVTGTFTPTVTVTDTSTSNPSTDITDVGELNLPSLTLLLTTRFPFSIPWDFVRAVKLLAAPAKIPHWEVDFYAPLADSVGGWKGSTAIVIDFAQFETLGALCRWTSTIGFCLMLLSMTKRLCWPS